MPDLARIRGSAIFLVLCCGKDAEFTFWPLLSPVSNFQPPSTEKRAESFYVDILLVEDSAPMRKLVATIVKRMGSERARGPERRRSSSCCSRRRWTWCSRIGACRSWTASTLVRTVPLCASTFPRSCACKAHKQHPLQGRWQAGPVGGYLTKVEFSSSEINR